ncbi:NAC transcription factor NAM-B2-like [Olea europaea var. sylvestris]|uniref:NAC transcription factor 25-like n=1 Tax=Olea europaea subsp. europaea TaxID=158383 RepID=A0A8S0QE00_OLEEU|nr:NAC transcription factor NAM-B2-like [Olea europaea var. sylvestris]CAA2963438.1 NAC transcription factor 25-like [Olea europaea subsp. europaea]
MALSIPEGFVFKPTDQKLITLYLKPKAMGSPLPCDRILDRNLYGENGTPWIIFSNNDPWEIVGESEIGIVKKEIYVFTKVKRIDRRHVRVAGCGTWAGKSKPKVIQNCKGEVIGVKKSFTFKVSGNLKQDELIKKNGRYIMHEYTLEGSSLEGVDNTDYAVCRISWDLPKCGVEEESWPTEMSDIDFSILIGEMTWNQALHNQELNPEADSSGPTKISGKESKMSDKESSSLIEEMNWNQPLHNQELNSEADSSWPPKMFDNEFSSLIEEMNSNQEFYNQGLISEADLIWQTEMSDMPIIEGPFFG